MNVKDAHDAYMIGHRAGLIEAMHLAQERGDNLDDKFVIGYNSAMRHVWTELSKAVERVDRNK